MWKSQITLGKNFGLRPKIDSAHVKGHVRRAHDEGLADEIIMKTATKKAKTITGSQWL